MPLTQAGRRLTVTTPLGADKFLLASASGREELSRPFLFTLDLVSDDPAVAPADLLGQPVSWTVAPPDDAPRSFHGLVRRFAAGPVVGRGLRRYRMEVVPWLWFLSRAVDCRIFQNQTAPAVVQAVFDRYGFSDYQLSLTATYPPREYCVQYRETALAFVSRLLEAEGIFYSHTFAADKHTLVLADAASAYTACDPHATVEYRPEASDIEAVFAWERAGSFSTGKAASTDYDFTKPTTSLLASTDTVVPVAKSKGFERFDFPGTHLTADRGMSLVKAWLEAEEAGYDLAAGTGGCSSFRPGATFTLTGHPADDCNAKYVLVAVDHAATDPRVPGLGDGRPSYANSFTCAPAAVPVRPDRLTPVPRTTGPQTAVVVGPSGQEIYTDEYGRVKVQFVWDRLGKADENSSCWVRAAEPWAGEGWGFQFLPRIGQEVVVDFLHGDPDRPIVTGRVFNKDMPRIYKLPDDATKSGIRTRSSPGGGADDFNEIMFQDKKGEEDFVVHAQKDYHRTVENDNVLSVLHDQSETVKNARTVTIQEADDKLTVNKGHRVVTIDKGDHKLTVSKGDRAVLVSTGKDTLDVDTGDRLVTVKTGHNVLTVKTGDRKVTVETGGDLLAVKTGDRKVAVDTGNDALEVKLGNHTIKVSAGGSTLEAMQSITLKCGPSEIKLGPDGITIKGLKVAVEATTTAEFKGLKVDVVASAMATLKGAIVQIN